MRGSMRSRRSPAPEGPRTTWAAAAFAQFFVAVYGGYTGHMASTLVLTKDR